MSSLLLLDVRPFGGDLVDVVVRDGMIERTGARLDVPRVDVRDGGPGLLLPGLDDAHAHLDAIRRGVVASEGSTLPR
jgi:cytosine/adenosine deaminase-related metal-dependent hydrolase